MMYRLLMILSVCKALDDFPDYWYSSDDGIVEDSIYPYKISENTLIKTSDSRKPDNTPLRVGKMADSKQALDILRTAFRKCADENRKCALQQLEQGIDFLMNSIPILGIITNLQDILESAGLVEGIDIDNIGNIIDLDK